MTHGGVVVVPWHTTYTNALHDVVRRQHEPGRRPATYELAKRPIGVRLRPSRGQTAATNRPMTADESRSVGEANRLPTAGPRRTRMVGPRERIASAVAGGTLVAVGLRRRSLGGVTAALLGTGLLYRGVTGRSRLYRALESGPGNHDRPPWGTPAGTTVRRTVTVGGSPEELHERWRDPEQLSQVLGHVGEVTAAGEGQYEVTVDAPFGRRLSWTVRVVEESPGDLLRWESLSDAAIPNEGAVHFDPAPDDRGTEVTLAVTLDLPGGAVGAAVLSALGVGLDPIVGTALRRFKSLAETGEVQTLEGNPSARGLGDLL